MQFFQAKDYQPRCKKLYLEYKASILEILPHALLEHIGASSIPDCLSKGDLDIYVAVKKDQHNDAIVRLEAQGFKIKQNTLRTPNLCSQT